MRMQYEDRSGSSIPYGHPTAAARSLAQGRRASQSEAQEEGVGASSAGSFSDEESDEGIFEKLRNGGPFSMICGGCCCCSLVTLLILVLCSWKGLSATEYGLTRNSFSGIVHTDHVYWGGRSVIGFWNHYITFPATLQTIEWTKEVPYTTHKDLEPMNVRTGEGLMVRLSLVVQYLLVKDKVAEMYLEFKDAYEAFFISVLRSKFQLVIADWEAEELWTKRSQVKDQMVQACNAVATGVCKGMVTCWDVQLLDVELDPMIDSRIIDRQVQQQQQYLEMTKRVSSMIRANTTVQEAMYDKLIKIVNANASKDAYNIHEKSLADADFNTEAAYATAMQKVKSSLEAAGIKMAADQLVQYYQNAAYIKSSASDMVFGAFNEVNAITKASGARRLSAEAAPARHLAAEEELVAAAPTDSTFGEL